MNPVSLLPHLL